MYVPNYVYLIFNYAIFYKISLAIFDNFPELIQRAASQFIKKFVPSKLFFSDFLKMSFKRLNISA